MGLSHLVNLVQPRRRAGGRGAAVTLHIPFALPALSRSCSLASLAGGSWCTAES